jgi:hypothetical protein
MTCQNGTLLGFSIDQIVNAMTNKQLQILDKLLGLPGVPNALLLQ